MATNVATRNEEAVRNRRGIYGIHKGSPNRPANAFHALSTLPHWRTVMAVTTPARKAPTAWNREDRGASGRTLRASPRPSRRAAGYAVAVVGTIALTLALLPFR